MIIGISGKPGTGKSHVVKFLRRQMRFAVISSDKIRKEVLKDPKLQADLVTTFGRKILHKTGTIEYSRLLFQAGKDTLRLKVMSEYIDKRIGEKIKQEIEANPNNYIIESGNAIAEGITDIFDISVLVSTPKRLAIVRLIKKIPLNIIDNMWRAQKDPKDYDYIIDNRTSIQDLKKDVEELVTEMLKSQPKGE
jgi:dephospho-CoA kinase